MRSMRLFAFLAVAWLLSAGRPAWAQIGGGEINGLLRDAQGAAVPGATVTATNTATGVTRPTITNEDKNVDLAIGRRIPMPMRSGTALELRAEAFNLLNTPPFANPGATLGAAAFGVISAAGDPRVVQLAAKFLFQSGSSLSKSLEPPSLRGEQRHELRRDEQPVLGMWNGEITLGPQDHVIVLAQVDDAAIGNLGTAKVANLECLEA